MQYTPQQRAAIETQGKVIVSASAGSGKTFVMIQKLVAAIENGVDLDSVLAVTFTKKAAAQMKEKLRSEIIKAMPTADKEKLARLKYQLSKIASADISTIHSFCARLIRTYFYAVEVGGAYDEISTDNGQAYTFSQRQIKGIDGAFDIISSDDAQAREFKNRAVGALFEKYYEQDDADFKILLDCYRRKRGDAYLKNLVLSSYEQLRINADYLQLLDCGIYSEEGFETLRAALTEEADEKYNRLACEVKIFAQSFYHPRKEYRQILDEMIATLERCVGRDVFLPQPPLTVTRKPADKTEEEKAAGERFKEFKDGIAASYKAIHGDICDEQTEKERFLKSGITARAFAKVLKEFDGAYTAIKLEENKLDYNDLEHLTLQLLKKEEISREISAKYSCVFVDEYQDVNPVQEEIVSRIGGKNLFLVGDVKQAIYGFRGSKSLFFAEKYNRYEGGAGSALRLSNNFRSSDGVLRFVNTLFAKAMTKESCGFDYSDGSEMLRGGGYPENYGSAQIHIFGKDEEDEGELDVYSVTGVNEVRHSRESLAVVEIVKRELSSGHYDLKQGKTVDTQKGDICILTRKRNRAALDIVKALEDAGYPVAGAQGADITSRPEVKQILDILSYIDNKQQDIPLATVLLSPIGGLTCDELAAVRVASKSAGRLSFRECCSRYIRYNNDPTAQKLRQFRAKIDRLRDLAEVFSAAEIIDEILKCTFLEAEYSKGGGDKLANVRRLASEGENISVSALLAKLKSGYEISAPTAAASDSIKIMTMHASKGLEFPVVIIADVCAAFRGRDATELPLSDEYGFAPKYFDKENMLTCETVLRKLVKEREGREELKNELNLFYVACTRAMCNLHILAEKVPKYNASGNKSCYADFIDFEDFKPQPLEFDPSPEQREEKEAFGKADEQLYAHIASRFAVKYPSAESVHLPVKSSASAILKMGEEDTVCTRQLFGGEGETGTERGIAYHRFLELCDFEIRDYNGIKKQHDVFLKDGLVPQEQCELLDVDTLVEILNIPVFSELKGAKLYREQEFLCRLPANEILPTVAKDGVLVQGAIDLLAKTDSGYKVIDYKYSVKSGQQLTETYSKQLALYKKAVALITKTPAEKIQTIIVNIFRKEQINL